MAGPEKRAIQQKRSLLPLLLILVGVIALLGLLFWYFVISPPEPAVTSTPSPAVNGTTPGRSADQPPPVGDYPGRSPRAAESEEAAPGAADQRRPPATTPEQAAQAARAGEAGSADPAAPPAPETECDKVSGRIKDFFTHLDQRQYIAARQLEEPTRIHFGRLIDQLLAQPPLVSGETDTILGVLDNTTHLYRVLQKENLLLLKEVLQNERDRLEEILATFHRWSIIAPECPPSGLGIHLPLPALYEYAGFFLNTLGGRSYLFRRAPDIRLLTQYYAVLILDRANEAGINRHGLDIRPTIDSLLAEIPPRDDLKQAEEYMATLRELQAKYLRQYGEQK
ncbi:MAG: hypothetical protein U5J62_03330 [Desulfurivibrio sp.]|nr:hypothetical protein [Desulfurivibrio sp.]